MPSPTVVGALALGAACAAAAAPRPWIKVTSSNFEPFANRGEKRAREAILYFEQVRDFFCERLHASRASEEVPHQAEPFHLTR